MRFAGTRIEGFLGDGPDYGELASNASTIRSREGQAVTDAMAKTSATGINAAGEVEAANIVGAAESALASAQGQASIMKGIGQIGGAAIGEFGGGGGGTSTFKWNPSGVDTTSAYTGDLNIAGQDYGSFLSGPTFNWLSN